jgi:hypothetical protein
MIHVGRRIARRMLGSPRVSDVAHGEHS